MERERLDELVRDPLAVVRQDLTGLNDLAERSPWFTGAQLLRAAGERSLGDVGFDATLQRTAAHLPSREVLFDLVERRPVAPPSGPAPLRIVEANDPSAIHAGIADQPAVVEPEVQAGTTGTLPSTAPIEDLPAEITEATTEAEARLHAPLTSNSPTEVDLAEQDDPLERQILEAALASAYDLTLHAPPPVVPPAPIEPSADLVLTTPQPEEVPLGALELSSEDPVAIQRAKVGRSLRLSFTDWLSEEVETAAARPHVPPTAPGSEEPRIQLPSTVAKSPAPPVPSGDIIDRFIEQENPAPVKKTAFFTPQQAAKRSLDDTAGLVTETLARIYEKQGNLPKAIDAYRKLGLKYPEKSAYFAALSRSLEEQLNP